MRPATPMLARRRRRSSRPGCWRGFTPPSHGNRAARSTGCSPPACAASWAAAAFPIFPRRRSIPIPGASWRGWWLCARAGSASSAMNAAASRSTKSLWLCSARSRPASADPLPDAVYVYDTCALKIMEAAKERGIRCIYDLPTGHYRAAFKIVEEERELRPEWALTLSGIHDSAEKLAGKDREIALADSIIVASSFTASTLETYPAPIGAPIFRIPYGAPPVGEKRELTRREDPLRVLFVGQMGHRKGLGYLIDAMDRLQVPANLTLVGRTHAVPPVLKQAFDRHRWIESAPHSEVLRLMREHDALVFPSLFDGFGLVMLEAMAQGTVVIATPNTAAPDLFDDGRDAFIVPIRSADAIAARLTQLAEDRELLAQ